ncbi:MAG: phosphatase [Firmicutes bacterium]|jgi:putative hydrolase|nr:phosphatase [Bacillota bacterium]
MRLVADLHIHSVATGHAYCTINEMAQAAADIGLEMIAITDHGPSMPDGPHLYYFGNLRVLPPTIAGVQVLKGIEANIIGLSGELDLPDHMLAQLDIVLAGFHSHTGYEGNGVLENTQAIIGALENPHVDGIVHPGNPVFPVDAREVVAAAFDLGKLIEINNASLTVSRLGSMENCVEFAELAAEYGAKVIISSDAHHTSLVGNFDRAIKLVKSVGLESEYVLNTDVRKITEFLRKRRKALN